MHTSNPPPDRPREGEPERATGRPGARGARWRARRRLVGLVVAGCLCSGTGVAVAAWTSSGPGSTTALAGSGVAPTGTPVPGSAFVTGLLYPGARGDVRVNVTNPNVYPVVAAVAPAAGAAVATGGTGLCGTSGVTVTTTASATVVSAGATVAVTFPNAAAMAPEADAGCQNATFTVPVTITVTSS